MFAAGCSSGKDDPPDDPVTSWSVSHYDYAIDFRTGAGLATLTVDVTGSGHCLAIPFGPLDADDVTIDGKRARVSIEDGMLSACGRQLDAETVLLAASFTLDEDTLNSSDIGWSSYDDAEGNEGTYLLSWVDECDRHGPCDSSPAAFATYRFTISHDPDEDVLCPGVITKREPDLTVCDFTYLGGPTYSTFGAISGEWDETDLGTWGGDVAVTLYDTPSTGIAAALQTSSLQGFFGWMEATIGEYPYGGELRLITANTYWNGFEHPGNIVLSDILAIANSDYTDVLTHVTMHEIAHQWAGDQTTIASTYDFVWKEAMAEYLTFVYEDESLAFGIAGDTAAAWKGFAEGADHPLVPDYAPTLISYYGDVYGPGPMVLFRQLEVMYGRPAVIAALQSVLGSQRALSVAELQTALEASTGADLGNYFDAWVFGSAAPTWPEATVSFAAAGGGNVDVSAVLVTGDGVARGCAFTVQLVGTGGNAFDVFFDFGPDGTAPASPQTVTPGFDVTGSLLDPYEECLVYLPGQAFGAGVERPHPWVARRASP